MLSLMEHSVIFDKQIEGLVDNISIFHFSSGL